VQGAARPAGRSSQTQASPSATEEAIGAITLIAARRWQPSRLVWGVLFASLTVIAFWSFIPGVSLGDHECYVAETSREMLADGDWIVPHFSGMPRLQKSPLAYWCVAGLATVLGRFSDTVVRMPSGIFGLALAGLMAGFGRRVFGAAALAWFAAAVTGFSGAWLFFTHDATVDMQLTFWCTLAGVLFWLAVNSEGRGRRIGLFAAMGAAIGIGMLAKMPMPAVVLLPGFLLYLLATGRARKIGPYVLESLPGIALMLAIWLPWVLMVLHRLDSGVVGAKWYREFFLRYEGEIGANTQPWYYYGPLVLGMVLPWTLSLPEALAGPWLSRYRPWRDVLMLAFCIAIFNLVFFSTAGYKRSQYVLPAMPWFLLLLTPAVWRFFGGPIYEHPKLVARLGLVLAGGALVAGVGTFIVLSYRDPGMAGRFAVPMGILVGGLALTGFALSLRARVEAMYVLLLTIAVTFCFGWMRAGLYWGGAQRERQFAAEVHEIVPPQAALFYLGRPDARLVYYGRLILPRVLSDLEIEQRIREGGMRRTAENAQIVTALALIDLFKQDRPVYVIATYDQWDKLTTLLPDFVKLRPQLLYRQTGFTEDPGKDWVLIANRAAATATMPAPG
jgi:4-amino-4-deoxy-L-arabinose transferase